MEDQAFNNLDFSRYVRWLRRISVVDYPIAVCGPKGKPLWSDDEDGNINWLCPINESGFDWHCAGHGMQKHICNDGQTLLYIPVRSRFEALLGYIAILAPESESISWDGLAEALEDMATAIADEHVMKSELNIMAEELSDRYEELHLVYAIDKKLRDIKEGEEIFTSLLKSCAEHMDVDIAAFVKPNEDFCVSATNLSKPIHNLDLVLVEMRGDLYRFASAARQPIVLNTMTDPRRAYIFTDMQLKVLCCPVFQNNAVVAVMVMVNHYDKADFSNSDRKLGEVLANQLSILSRLYGMLSEASKFNTQMAATLIEAVEAKDPYTRGHSERVHHIAMQIGHAMDLPESELDNLYWGALLHDVGKIGIPDAILCKPSRLTSDEMTFIMVHPERSYEILRHIDRLKGAVPGARHHQEKFDGTGYPHQLKGAAIPLIARIIATADTYDSITSSRAYRAGRSHEVAIRELDRYSGSQLDPQIVGLFKSICESNPEWMKRFNIKREAASVLKPNVLA
jgi:HD-GYP domain-containing protein (c-di-GMP phosphodiesterase class II)